MLVVGIDEDDALITRSQEVVEFALRLDNSFQRAEALQMRLAYVRDESAGRLSSLGQSFNVAGMASTHLHNGNIVFGCKAQQRLRYAHIVVEVTFGGHDVIFLGKHCANKFLCGSLAIGTGDADDGNLELASMLAC